MQPSKVHHVVFGSALIIQLPEQYQQKDTVLHLQISYRTGDGEVCSAILVSFLSLESYNHSG